MAERSRLFIVLLCSLECILCTWMTNLLLSFFITISTSVPKKSLRQDDFHFMEYTQSGTEEILLLLDFVFWSKVSRIHCWLRILAEGKEHCSSHVSQLSISYNTYLYSSISYNQHLLDLPASMVFTLLPREHSFPFPGQAHISARTKNSC